MSTQAISYEAECGSDAGPWTLTILDSAGQPVTTWTSAATLACRATIGGAYAPAFAPSVAWIAPGSGTVALSIAAAQTASVKPGLYPLSLSLNGSRERPIGVLRLTPGAGALAAPRTYCDFADCAALAPWIESAEDFGPGLAAGVAANLTDARVRATRDIDEAAMARARTALSSQQRAQGPLWMSIAGGIMAGGYDAGPFFGASTLPDSMVESAAARVRAALDAGQLMTDASTGGRLVRQACAALALFYALRHQPGSVGKDGPTYADLAKDFRSEGRRVLFGSILAIDTDNDGLANYLLKA